MPLSFYVKLPKLSSCLNNLVNTCNDALLVNQAPIFTFLEFMILTLFRKFFSGEFRYSNVYVQLLFVHNLSTLHWTYGALEYFLDAP